MKKKNKNIFTLLNMCLKLLYYKIGIQLLNMKKKMSN